MVSGKAVCIGTMSVQRHIVVASGPLELEYCRASGLICTVSCKWLNVTQRLDGKWPCRWYAHSTSDDA